MFLLRLICIALQQSTISLRVVATWRRPAEVSEPAGGPEVRARHDRQDQGHLSAGGDGNRGHPGGLQDPGYVQDRGLPRGDSSAAAHQTAVGDPADGRQEDRRQVATATFLYSLVGAS